MSKIKIKNFGPIKEGFKEVDETGKVNEYIDIKKVTVFIGNQGSGKSVVGKLISTFTWIEKALTRGDYDKKHFERKNKLKNQYLTYHRLENYFPKTDDTIIDYIGDSFHILFDNGNLTIEEVQNSDYQLPQIMYVPAERNFLSNVRSPKALKQISPSLSEFVTEVYRAGNDMKGPMLLPINNEVNVEYNKLNDIFYIKGKDYRINLTEASSGFQSLVPLYLVSWFTSNSVKLQTDGIKDMSSEERERFRKRFKEINENADLSEDLRRIAISEIGKGFTKTAFINIVEEPEQNLYPASQRSILYSLTAFNNINNGNKLVLTTHSPYLINYLTLAVKANSVLMKIKLRSNDDPHLNALNKIVPIESVVDSKELVIYELNEKDGSIIKLGEYEGIPSDKNYLNELLGIINNDFDDILSIEEEL